MIKKIYLATCILLALAGLSFAFLTFAQRYAEEEPMPLDGKPAVVDGRDVVYPEDLPKLYPVGDFTFTGQDGQPVSQETVKGKIWVGYLFFSSCPAQCPIMTSNIRKVTERFLNNDRVHFMGVSVDPKRDTPEQLARYAEQYKANNPRWHFVTGPEESMGKLAVEGFRLGSVEEPQFHSDKFVLVDETGTVRGYFTGIEDPEVDRLAAAIDKLLEEASPTPANMQQ